MCLCYKTVYKHYLLKNLKISCKNLYGNGTEHFKNNRTKTFLQALRKLDFETRIDAQIYSTMYLKIYYLLFVLLEKCLRKALNSVKKKII